MSSRRLCSPAAAAAAAAAAVVVVAIVGAGCTEDIPGDEFFKKAAADTGDDAGKTADTSAPQDAAAADSASVDAGGTPDVTGGDTASADTGETDSLAGGADSHDGASMADSGCVANGCPASTNLCKKAVCGKDGTCVLKDVAKGSKCDDGDSCTVADACDGKGACVPGKGHECPSDNPCMTVTCDGTAAAPKCVAKPVKDHAPCADASGCEKNAFCTKGTCGKGIFVCGCVPAGLQGKAPWSKYPEIVAGKKACGWASATNKCLGKQYCDTSKVGDWKCKTIPATVTKQTCAQPGSPCLLNTCDPATGACSVKPAPSNTPCDDGSKCTPNDFCKDGKCTSTTNVCPCTPQTAAKDCAHLNASQCGGVYCDTSAADVKGWKCAINKAAIVKCSIGSDTECLKNACDPLDGHCKMTSVTHVKKANKSCKAGADDPPCPLVVSKTSVIATPVCDDGDSCTASETCFKGVCGAADVAKKKAQLADADPKNDHLPTGGEGTRICTCTKDADCENKDDGDFCNGTLACDKLSGKCVPNPASLVVCPTIHDTGCVRNFCYATSGVCKLTPRTHIRVEKIIGGASKKSVIERAFPYAVVAHVSCSDGDACTANDHCKGATCVAGSVNVCACKKDSDCIDDGDSCNGTPYCDASSGSCRINPATIVTCPDKSGLACLVNRCVPKTGLCALTPHDKPGQPCEDGHPCTFGDQCVKGVCVAGISVCKCTTDAECASASSNKCLGAFFCDKTKAPFSCRANPAKAVNCDAAGDTFCLKNRCNPATGTCKVAAVSALKTCDDGDPCTPHSTCDGGACTADVNVCACKKSADCASFADPNNKCAPTLFCDKSKGIAVCRANPASVPVCDPLTNPCAPSACDPKSGKCAQGAAEPKTVCSDGSPCTVGDTCDGNGTCKPGTNVCACTKDDDCADADDGNPCNGTFLCDKSGKSSACRLDPTSVVSCKPGAASDGCWPGCDPKTGKCTAFIPNTNKCDDGNACTTSSCSTKGACIALKKPDGVADTIGGFCVGGVATQIPDGMALIPAGNYAIGCNAKSDLGPDGKPRCKPHEEPHHIVPITSFWIDRFEVTVARYNACKKAGKCKDPVVGLGNCTLLKHAKLAAKVTESDALSAAEQTAVNCVNHTEATAFCAWAIKGGLLPSSAQWEAAARSPCTAPGPACKKAATNFPWGNKPEASCSHSVVAQPGAPCHPTGVQPVGSRAEGDVTQRGVHDLGGNVAEWTRDGWDPKFYASPAATKKNPVAPANAKRVLRGGRYTKPGTAARTAHLSPADQAKGTIGVGFRCVKLIK